ncbi:hypothetical protein ASPWEDRAFT_43655 [Aspergillus wentii DTO 134E9]|uniref:MmgE/PrpD family protein n=1 Tax=Aspergillus wentii DTO 134E9 TaxID=1073089 RepID=A0A1L9R793_ASPWE|nr:uncharacterized protein ASPWEDRAFT_186768 [Aspergillus wentii DTO 134E9]XP_040685379.1 uncharacterized protein ASPWEDRAFT_43655 [Aspergillus wentii DTO 134E9]OJJ30779.1 hypothetical protein ASPWEDRAFT_186768 [Aspergillus wentii DTO 134E9]OJJ31702.1 hypothetical protein ASPWEDRAFT_43655 [Aspergillus wentii DTO 134E9]
MGGGIDVSANKEPVTEPFASWVASLSLSDVPEDVRTRVKHILLDGLGCALLGSKLPWSVKAKEAICTLEGPGKCSLIGYNQGLGPLPAALLNSTFLQAFEMDEFHFANPIHGSSVIIPAIFAAAQHESSPITGASLLLAALVGYETGPRVGAALGGHQILGMGWHSGPIFGPAASAAAVSKLWNQPAEIIEESIGTACTQAGGLMSAQYESMVKRMQHGFAARSGVLAASLSREGFRGIKKVFDREYGGFLTTFSLGSKNTPRFDGAELLSELGSRWDLLGFSIKRYASCATTHGSVDCIRTLLSDHPDQMKDVSRIAKITIYMPEVARKRAAFAPERPITAIAAQMSAPYAVAVALLDGDVTPHQFATELLGRDAIWEIMPKVTCTTSEEFYHTWAHKAVVEFDDGTSVTSTIKAPTGVDPALTNEGIVDKFRTVTKGVITEERQRAIEKFILNLEDVEDVNVALKALLDEETVNVIA